MPKLTEKRLTEVGLPLGRLVRPEERKIEKTRIAVVNYDETQFQERQAKTVEECLPFKDANFENLAIFLGFWSFAVNLAVPFFTVYMLKRLELKISFIIYGGRY